MRNFCFPRRSIKLLLVGIKKEADILCYQIRQSFLPGEVDAETALKIGYDTAMRWTKGKRFFSRYAYRPQPYPQPHIFQFYLLGLYKEIPKLLEFHLRPAATVRPHLP